MDHGKILLGLRARDNKWYPNVWDLFGGHVECEETVEAALVRELREELDITATKFQFLATFTIPNPHTNGEFLYHIFKVTSWSGPGPLLRGDEHAEIRWFTLDEALVLELAAPEYQALFRENVA